ncbi:MAG: RNA polymerase sigma factor [Chitinophagaceae bacterium]|nr:RNA polymerase sigma factor [Chitinophagaceae bacterium]
MQDYILANFTESQMIQESINGCPKMQKTLYNRFAPKMYRVCLCYTNNNTDDAKDVLQEGFIKVFKNLHKFRHDVSFEGWIRTIIIRTALSQIKDKNKKLISFNTDLLYAIKDTEASIQDKLAEKDIISLVKKLPPGYRKIFILYAMEGYNHREIAVLLNCSEGTSKSQLYRSKTRLQEIIRKTA